MGCLIVCFQVTGESSAHFKIEPGQPLDVMCDDGMHGYHGSTNTPMGTIDRISCCIESV